ncbi:MAG TPA: hypothetical protein VH912_07645 [Streptosporangiaceae bacterium]
MASAWPEEIAQQLLHNDDPTIGILPVVDRNDVVFKDLRTEVRDGFKGVDTRIDGLRLEINDVRGDVNGLRTDVGELRDDMHNEISGLRSEMHSEITGLRTEMRTEITGLRTEMHNEIGGVRSEIADVRTEVQGVNGKLDLILEKLN